MFLRFKADINNNIFVKMLQGFLNQKMRIKQCMVEKSGHITTKTNKYLKDSFLSFSRNCV